jgi:hypothetical protein
MVLEGLWISHMENGVFVMACEEGWGVCMGWSLVIIIISFGMGRYTKRRLLFVWILRPAPSNSGVIILTEGVLDMVGWLINLYL